MVGIKLAREIIHDPNTTNAPGSFYCGSVEVAEFLKTICPAVGSLIENRLFGHNRNGRAPWPADYVVLPYDMMSHIKQWGLLNNVAVNNAPASVSVDFEDWLVMLYGEPKLSNEVQTQGK